MRRHLTVNSALTAILAGTAMLFWSAIAFAGTPSLGADCGAGASIVGSDSAGKVTVGASQNVCTITFSVPYPNAPACMATNETGGTAVGLTTTPAGAVLSGPYPFAAGNVISYICQDY
jgi:hypothetical protein